LMGMAGIAVIFLSHVRSSLVVVVVCALILSTVMMIQGRLRTVLATIILIVVCGIGGFLYAELYGGKSIVDRFATLIADSPLTVFEKSARMTMVIGAFDT